MLSGADEPRRGLLLDINALFRHAGAHRRRYSLGNALKDLAALPTNVGLTLWDALPVYLSIAVALALVARVWLPQAWFAGYWSMRWLLDPTGLAYLALFARPLVPIYVLTCVAAVGLVAVLRTKSNNSAVTQLSRLPLLATHGTTRAPTTPIGAVRQRAGEVFGAVLVAALVAGVINLFSHYLPDAAAYVGLSLLAGAFVGPAFGPSALPAVAADGTSGSAFVGAVWLIMSACLTTGRILVVNSSAAGDSPAADSTLRSQPFDG